MLKTADKSPGFTLIEVLIALVIMVSALSITTRLTVGMTGRFQFMRDQLSKVLVVKNKLLERLCEHFVDKAPAVQKLENPVCILTTQVREIGKESVLKEFAKDIKIVQVKAEWQPVSGGGAARKADYSLSGFLPVVLEKKK